MRQLRRFLFTLLLLAAWCADAHGQEFAPECRNATSGKLEACVGRLKRSFAPLFDVQRFTTVGAISWVKPVGSYQRCTFRCCGGGGGGGSGSRRPAPGGGGAGGSGGGCSQREYAYSDLSAASYAGLVGGGGTAGAAATVDNSNGNAGGAGGVSQVIGLCLGGNGQGGAGGTSTTSNGGVAAEGMFRSFPGGNGGTGGGTQPVSAAGAGPSGGSGAARRLLAVQGEVTEETASRPRSAERETAALETQAPPRSAIFRAVAEAVEAEATPASAVLAAPVGVRPAGVAVVTLPTEPTAEPAARVALASSSFGVSSNKGVACESLQRRA